MTGGIGGFTYRWDDPLKQTNPTATGLRNGTYRVTVTDSQGCRATAQATVKNLNAPSVTTTTVPEMCPLSGSATAKVTAGSPPFSYRWDDPLKQTNPTATGLRNGTYKVTVTDKHGCSAVAVAKVTKTSPSALSVPTPTTTPETCPLTGSATATGFGGCLPYRYEWRNPNAPNPNAVFTTHPTATGLRNGNYNVTVTDDAGQVVVAQATVASLPPLDPAVCYRTETR